MRVIERSWEHAEYTSEQRAASELGASVSPRATVDNERLALRLAACAGLAAALASLAGFIPGLYRDPQVIVEQSHGYDVANLVVVIVLEFGLLAASRGSVRGRLISMGALGCLVYSFCTYAFLIVLNPATLLYIAVLGFAGWAFVAGITHVEDSQVDALVEGRLPRRTTSAFLAVLAVVFAATWLSQIVGALISGDLPADLVAAGWPMNPVWVLDLGFVLPLALVTALGLARRRAGAERIGVSFLVFDMLLSLSILLMAASAGLAGQPIAIPMIAIFMVLLAVSFVLCWLALRRR